MNGILCVKKNEVSFTSIDVDHALEQENSRLKVLGGISGITLKPATLRNFFLVSPELARLSKQAEDKVDSYVNQANRAHVI